MPDQPTVNVIGPDYNAGLLQSGRVVAKVLEEAGCKVRFLQIDDRRRHRWRQWGFQPPFDKFLQRDVNVFLERLPSIFFKMARYQVLVPNQEWVGDNDRASLPHLDLVLCKTRHAEEIFSKMGCKTAFCSFTSTDRRKPAPEPKRREFFLMSANRPLIAERVISLWERHPEWPTLTVSSRHIPPGVELPNVKLMRDIVPMEDIIRLQNSLLFHICTTSAEGFGHKLNEAMSCGAIVLATDGPPMNELIRPERGFLVKWKNTSPKSLGTEYHFDENDLEQNIERCIALTPAEIEQRSANARGWYEQNDRYFRESLPQIVRDLIAGGAPARQLVKGLTA